MHFQLIVFMLFLFIPLAIGAFTAYDYAREAAKTGNWWP